MPLRPEDLEFMRQYSAGADPNALRAQLANMYGPGPGTVADAAADPRLAQNMSVEPPPAASPYAPTVENVAAAQRAAPPAPSPAVPDVGPRMSVAEPSPVASEAPAMSTVSPSELAAMGKGAEARLAASSEEGAPAPEGPAAAPYDPVGEAKQRALIAAYRGAPAKFVPGGEQLEGATIQREIRGQVSPETSAELETARTNQQLQAVTSGGTAASGLEAIAAEQGKQAEAARAQLAQYRRDNASKQAEYEVRQSEIQDLRNQVNRDPISFWSGKDTGTQIIQGIGLFLLGLGGGPEIVQRVIDRDIAIKQKAREQNIGLLGNQLDRLHEMMPSPEAQQAFTRSLALDAAASQTESLASNAKAEDARQRGYALAADLRRQALEAQAAAQNSALAKVETKTKNVPDKYLGGRAGGFEAVAKFAKETGTPFDEALQTMITGQRAGAGTEPRTEVEVSKAKFARSVAVRLPDGSEAYASDPEQKKDVQGVLQSSDALMKNYDELARLVAQHSTGPLGSAHIDPKALGRIRANISDNLLTLKEAKKLGVLSESDLKLIDPLSGSQAEDYITGPQFLGALERSREIAQRSIMNARALLSSSPWAGNYISTPAGGKGSTFKPRAR